MKLPLIIAAVLITGLLAGCGGGGAKVTNTTVSEGQELIDLKRAFDLGVITEKEYEAERKKILKG